MTNRNDVDREELRLQETVTLTRRQLRDNAAAVWDEGYHAHRDRRQRHNPYREPAAAKILDTAITPGTDVTVTRDDGSEWLTKTRTEPWQLGDGTWVVALEGRAGGFSLERVRRR